MSARQKTHADSRFQPPAQSSGGPHLKFEQRPNSQTEVSCWGVTEGAAGMVSQVKGVAQAVGLPFTVHAIPLRFPWRKVWPGIVPVRKSVFASPAIFDDRFPKLLIACGKQSVLTSLYLKKQLRDQIFTVQIQDPKIDCRKFDLVIPPEHDGLVGPNVISSTGAVHHITRELLEHEAAKGRIGGLSKLKENFALVLIGGPTRYFKYTDGDMLRFEQKLVEFANRSGLQLAILTSRRTPKPIFEHLRDRFQNDHYVWNPSDENPYLSAMALCSHLIVTGDSISMISEASATGKPVFVEYLTEHRTARRFRRFYQSFEKAGITRRFEGELDTWTYAIKNDTAAIAQIIREKMQARGLLG